MPYKLIQQPSTRLPSIKAKNIAKNKKIKNKGIQDTPIQEYIEENTLSDTTISNEESQMSKSSFILVLMFIKQLHSICHYGQDTLYVCLQLLNRLKIQIEENKTKLYAAVILQMAAKIHQYRTPRLVDLVNWGNDAFSRQDLVAVEGIILLLLNFRIPASLSFKSLKQMEEAIRRVQLKISSKNLYTFQ